MKEIYAEIITIGDELLFGQITDTNSQWISAELDKIGVRTRRKTSVGDKREEILSALSEAETRADIVLMTGGLGPTKDDITKKVLAEYFGAAQKRDEQALQELQAFFDKLGRELDELNLGQVELPANSTRIPNKLGTAPGMWFEERQTCFASMPGVPFEMKAMLSDTVIPNIQKKFSLPAIHHKMIRTIGVGESRLAGIISDWEEQLPAHIQLAYLPGTWQVRLRLTAVGQARAQLERAIEAEYAKVHPIIDKYVYGYGDIEIQEALGTVLRRRGLTAAFAESCTGGFISQLLSSVPGSSDYFLGAVVAYSNQVKMKQLGVQPDTLHACGAVSEQTAVEMAAGVRERLGSDIGLAATGIAGPGGGTAEKPVGTVWLALSSQNKVETTKLNLARTRQLNINHAAVHALNMIRLCLD